MSKKVLVLSSTPRKGGNSDILCDYFIKGALESGNEAEKIFLKDKNIHYCLGCGYCASHGYNGCAHEDDLQEVLDKMLASDVIVMATPVYFYTMCAQMKTLIDRCCSKYTKITGKEFYFIMTAAEGNPKLLERTHDGFRGFLDCLSSYEEKGAIYASGVWERGEVESTDFPKQAYEMGKNI